MDDMYVPGWNTEPFEEIEGNFVDFTAFKHPERTAVTKNTAGILYIGNPRIVSGTNTRLITGTFRLSVSNVTSLDKIINEDNKIRGVLHKAPLSAKTWLASCYFEENGQRMMAGIRPYDLRESPGIKPLVGLWRNAQTAKLPPLDGFKPSF